MAALIGKRNYLLCSIAIFFGSSLVYDCAAADVKTDNNSVIVTKLEDGKIYTFRNKHDSGILTAINIMGEYPPIVTDKWRDAATQKWKAVGSYFYSGYQLKPTSDEAKVLNLDTNKKLISQDSPGMGIMNGNQYWETNYVGHGFHQLRNVKTDECLRSMGNGKRVGARKCVNVPKEQWQIDEI